MACQCGCGQPIPRKRWHRWTAPRYIAGHWQRSEEIRGVHRRTSHRIAPPAVWVPPSGVCECGCGERTPVSRYTHVERDRYAGFPLRFVHGHNPRGEHGSACRNWKGGVKVNEQGYRLLHRPGHHLANGAGYVLEHRLVWEEANRRRLRDQEHVHHVDGNRLNNDPANLVAMTNAEHRRLHCEQDKKRKRARAS